MADSFFGFDTAQLLEDELEVPEAGRDYDDRFNSETFGADADEWEEDDHEKIAAQLERERSAIHAVSNGHALPADAEMERFNSELMAVIDDACVDEWIRACHPPPAGVPIPRPLQQLSRTRSPPVSSLLESDISGSPSTNSIWSTTPTRQPPPPPPAAATAPFQDPAIMSAGPARLPPPPPAGRIRTVEELEQDLLSRSPARSGPPPGFGSSGPPPPPAQVDLSRPPPMRLPPPTAGVGRPAPFRLPNTQLPPPSVTSMLPPQLMHKDRGGRGGPRPAFPMGRGTGHLQQQQHHHQQQRYQQDRRRQDPCAGLMTQRERQWLLNIQRMQVKGNSDYYFRHLNWRKLSQGRRDSRGGGDRQKDRDDKHTDHRNYKPPEMENSLGKLQVASVTAPRKIIDLGVINHECGDGPKDHKEAKRDRQTLLLIEQLYTQLMALEEADRRAAGEAGPDSEPEEDEEAAGGKPELARAAAAARLWAALSRQQHLLHILCVRKGKSLVLRCIPVLNSGQYYVIATTLLKHLVQILHKDKTDAMLDKFFVCLQMVISNSDLSQIVELTAALAGSSDLDSSTPGKTPLQFIVSSSLGVSVTVLLLLRGDLLSQQPAAAAAVVARWQDLYAGLVRCLSSMPTLATPLEPVPAPLLTRHIAEPRLVARLAGGDSTPPPTAQ